MACKHHVVAPVLFIRWQDACEASDIPLVQAATEAAHKKIGEDLIYVGIIPADVAPPDGDARAALRAGTEHASQHCRSIHIVIEGQGLRRALIRSISAGLLLATRKTSRGFHIHETVEGAMEATGLSAEQCASVMADAGDAGMLSSPA